MSKVIDPNVADAIGAILKDMRDQIEARLEDIEAKLEKALDHEPIKKDIEAVTSATMALVDERVEWARLDADLWKETSKNELRILREDRETISKTLEDAEQLVEELGKQLSDQSALLQDIEGAQLNPLGPWRDGVEYLPGDIVMRDGASLVAVRKTREDPRTKFDEPHYRLLSMRGEKGARGQRGPQGEDGVHVLAVELKGTKLAMAMSDASVFHVELGPMIKQALEEIIGNE